MRTSQKGLELIKKAEGVCLVIKPDNKGQQIGHGHDMQQREIISKMVYDVDVSNGISMIQADYILDRDLATKYEPAVNRLAPQANQNQFDALVDFTYNLGVGALATMLHHGFDVASMNILAWCYMEKYGVEIKSDSLEARRQAEVKLFQTPVV